MAIYLGRVVEQVTALGIGVGKVEIILDHIFKNELCVIIIWSGKPNKFIDIISLAQFYSQVMLVIFKEMENDLESGIFACTWHPGCNDVIIT